MRACVLLFAVLTTLLFGAHVAHLPLLAGTGSTAAMAGAGLHLAHDGADPHLGTGVVAAGGHFALVRLQTGDLSACCAAPVLSVPPRAAAAPLVALLALAVPAAAAAAQTRAAGSWFPDPLGPRRRALLQVYRN